MKFILLAFLVAITGVVSNPAKQPEAIKLADDTSHMGQPTLYRDYGDEADSSNSQEMNSTLQNTKILECTFIGVKGLLACEFDDANNWKDLISVMKLLRCSVNSIMDTVQCFKPSLISQIKLDDRTNEDLIKALVETFNKIYDERIFGYLAWWPYKDENVESFLNDMYEILEKIAKKYKDDNNGNNTVDSDDMSWNGDDLISLIKVIRCGLNSIIDTVHCIMTTSSLLISQIDLNEQTNEDLIKILMETYKKIKDDKMMNAFADLYFEFNDEIIESFILDMYNVLEEIAKKYDGYEKISDSHLGFWFGGFSDFYKQHGYYYEEFHKKFDF